MKYYTQDPDCRKKIISLQRTFYKVVDLMLAAVRPVGPLFKE